MSFGKTLGTAVLAIGIAVPAFAADIMVKDAYARTSMKGAKSGGAFMQIVNTGSEDDRLIGVSSDIAKKVELHTNIAGDNGVMRMVHVEDGFVIPAGETHIFKRGGDHVMFMGLTQDMVQGGTVPVTLTFEKAGDVKVDVEVDLER